MVGVRARGSFSWEEQVARLVEARAGGWVVAGLAVWSFGCGGDKTVAGPGSPKPEAPAFLAILSNAVQDAAAAGSGQAAATQAEVVFISLPPGTIPGSEVATIGNLRTGATLTIPMAEGGFDPVSIIARTGDTLQVEVRVAAVTTPVNAVFVVPPRKRPIVVRTDPPPGKRDVPLNASLLIVFSEPIDPATLSPPSVQLLSDGSSVHGTIDLVSGRPWIATFTPTSPLEPETEYELAVTQDVRDLDGDPLEAAASATFTTRAAVEARIAFVSTRDSGSPGGRLGSVPYIYVANSDGSGVSRLTQGEAPAWSFDGRKIAFHRWSGGAVGSGVLEIGIINADGSAERELGQGLNPVWSPDGTKLLFHSGSGNPEGGIFVMNADGSGVTRLISHEFANPGGESETCVCWPSWSPDGRSIAFVRANYAEPWQIYIMKADGSQPRRLSYGYSAGDSRPAWSPDGTRLLLQAPSPSAIISVDVNGSNFQWHAGATYVGQPDWSPDGSSIVFEKFTAPGDATNPVGSRMRIFVVSTAGGDARQLIPEAVASPGPDYWDAQPAWSRVKK